MYGGDRAVYIRIPAYRPNILPHHEPRAVPLPRPQEAGSEGSCRRAVVNRGSALSGASSTVSGASRASGGASSCGIRSTSPAMMRLASAWAWRSAASCSCRVRISSSVWSGLWSVGCSSGKRTYTWPPARSCAIVLRLVRPRMASAVTPNASAAWSTVSRRLGGFVRSSPAPPCWTFGDPAQALRIHPRAPGGQREAPGGRGHRCAC